MRASFGCRLGLNFVTGTAQSFGTSSKAEQAVSMKTSAVNYKPVNLVLFKSVISVVNDAR